MAYRYALVIGISKYSSLRPLPKAVNDAEAIAQLLEKYGEFVVKRYPGRYIENENRYEIKPAAVSATNLWKCINKFLALISKKKADGLIFIASHGLNISEFDETEGYIALSKHSQSQRDAIPFRALNKIFSKSSHSSLTVLLDCCHSGLAIEQAIAKEDLRGKFTGSNFAMLAACRGDQNAYENNKHSVFTSAILEACKQDNARGDGKVTFLSLADFVKKKLKDSGQEAEDLSVGGASICLLKYLPKKNSNFIQLIASNLPSYKEIEILCEDFNFSEISEDVIERAYKASLPKDSDIWRESSVHDISAVLSELQGLRRVPLFFQQLSQDNKLAKPLQIKCQNIVDKLWLEKNTKNKRDFNINRQTQSEIIDSYLIVKLTPENNGNKVFLNSWLIPDDSLEGLSKFVPILHGDQQENGVICQYDHIEIEIEKFVKKSLKQLRGKRSNLILEFFVPISLMFAEIDQWKTSNPFGETIVLGSKFPIRLRSLERLNLDYLDYYLSDWHDSWEKFKKILNSQDVRCSLAEIEISEQQDWESLDWKSMELNLKEKVGLKIPKALPIEAQKNLFKTILKTTTPFALWVRCDMPTVDASSKMDELISLKSLRYLCESIRDERQKADLACTDYFGRHLSLLWENPNRLTPDVMCELQPPGQ